MTKTSAKKKVADHVIIGDEPKLSGEISRLELVNALNWYSRTCEISKTRQWISEWMADNKYTKKQVQQYKQSNSCLITQTKASIARLLLNGTMSSELETTLRTHINDVLDAPLAVKVAKKTIAIQPDIINPVVADMDDILDQFYTSGYKKLPDITSTEKAQKATHIKDAIVYYAALLEETKDRDDLPAAQLKRYVKLLTDIVAQLDNSKPVIVRKTIVRKKRPVPVEKVVGKLKYMKKNELAVSVDPKKIVDSSVIWVYNNKNRKLTKLVAIKGEKLSVKGTSIINFDPDQSFSKTIRKPDEVIPPLAKEAKMRINSIFKQLTTKQSAANGRINDQMILLRMFK